MTCMGLAFGNKVYHPGLVFAIDLVLKNSLDNIIIA